MYNFVIDCSEEELIEFRKIKSVAEYQEQNAPRALKILLGPWVWCVLTYVNLANRGNLPVTLSNKYSDELINFAHSDTLIEMPGASSQFIVCIQADYTHRGWTHFHIVQNKNQVAQGSAFVPLWVHPGLIGRDVARTKVERVAYAGQTFNNNLAGSTDSWKQLVEPHGIEFVAVANNAWHDLRAIDVLVGVRSFDRKPYDKKPPSKLINAWHAQIPFVGGQDSAYKQIGTPGEDYLLVETPEQIVDALIALRNDEVLYAKLVNNGKAKAIHYTDERIAESWETILTGPVLTRYKQWQNAKGKEALRFVVKRGIGLLEHQAKRTVKRLLKSIKK